MDVNFLLRGRRGLGESRPARLDHRMLTAALAAQQSASAAARAQAAATVPPGDCGADREPLSELLLGGPQWREAAAAQKGCFNRAGMKRRVNVS